jgi:hypothetical protein
MSDVALADVMEQIAKVQRAHCGDDRWLRHRLGRGTDRVVLCGTAQEPEKVPKIPVIPPVDACSDGRLDRWDVTNAAPKMPVSLLQQYLDLVGRERRGPVLPVPTAGQPREPP